jgi:hypothetical protein
MWVTTMILTENYKHHHEFNAVDSWIISPILNTVSSLENALRSFACLTVEDLVEFKYNDKVYFRVILFV